jgi:enoyl-CoA hydratase/carnithine racemase
MTDLSAAQGSRRPEPTIHTQKSSRESAVQESDQGVLVDLDGSVATVILNRPHRHNALVTDMKIALYQALHEVARDDSVQAVVLTGAGGAFCVGQDLAEHARALGADAATAFGTADELPCVNLRVRPPGVDLG